jgi:fucose permease
MGLVFYGNFFYLPIYFQSVLEYNALISGALLLPLIIATSVMSVISGQIMARTGSYKICIVVGFGLWTVGAGMKCKFNRNTRVGMIIGSLIMEGLGTGWTLQPSKVPR